MKSLTAAAEQEEAADSIANRNAIAEPETQKITRVPVRKLTSFDYYRIKLDPAYRMAGARVIEDKQSSANRGFYLVAPGVKIPLEIQKDIRSATIYTAQSHTGDTFLIVLPKNEMSWYDSARDIVQIATKRFIRVVANMKAGSYDYFEPKGAIPEPDWSSLPPFEDLLVLGFKDRLIESTDHKFIRLRLGDVSEGAEQDDRF